jgi:hypothetical protein
MTPGLSTPGPIGSCIGSARIHVARIHVPSRIPAGSAPVRRRARSCPSAGARATERRRVLSSLRRRSAHDAYGDLAIVRAPAYSRREELGPTSAHARERARAGQPVSKQARATLTNQAVKHPRGNSAPPASRAR